MGQNDVAIVELDLEHGIGQGLEHPAFDLYALLFGH
jgi:hypothetical protein